MSGQIFVSYRREDSSGTTGRLFDRLTRRFPRSRIFMDVDSIEPGEDFLKNIEQAVASCDVLIAVIGTRWLLSSDREGKSRLENPEDFVRLELVTALKRGIPVIPALVEGASMPSSRDLPDELEPLTRRHALELSHTRFNTDADRLLEAIDRTLKKTKARRKPAQQAGTTTISLEQGEIEDIRADKIDAGQTVSHRVETSNPSDSTGAVSPKKEQTSGPKTHFLLRSIIIVASLILVSALVFLMIIKTNEVKVGDQVFLHSREGSYVVTAEIANYNWPRLGNVGKVALTLLGHGPLRRGSAVQIQSLEPNLKGNDILEASATFNSERPQCYYWKRDHDEKRQDWIVDKLDASDPVLHYGDKIYLVNTYYNNKRLTQDSQYGHYLTIDEGVDWWWVLEKK